jgi:anti-sigma factor RsiW
MMGFGSHHRDRSFPELLAAYADGELDAAARARVETWLAEHPEARAELETQRRLSRRNQRLWQASAGPAPSETSWARLFEKVQGALPTPVGPVSPAARGRRILRFAAPVLAAAAAAVLGVLLLKSPTNPGAATDPADEQPLAVATDGDIEIVSIQEADTDRLVVGVPPLRDPIKLASANDVELVKVEKDTDGMMPQVQMNAGPNAPMIIAPIAGR